MADDDAPECPKCERKLTYVRDVPFELKGGTSADSFKVPLASAIYRCPDHGSWRVYISGQITRHTD